jgi:hypothetical protein
MAKIILMVPMTSIASELDFLTGGRVLRNSCGWLKPETLESLFCGQDWIYHDKALYKCEVKFDEFVEEEVHIISQMFFSHLSLFS